MLCFAGITPHTPLLVPGVGKENTNKLQKTIEAMNVLAEELYASRPDTIVVLSSHAVLHEQAFSINLHDSYELSFKDFGDLKTKKTFACDPSLTAEIQNHMYNSGIPFSLESQKTLDYGTGVPLFYLADKLTGVRIVPLSFSGLTQKEHVKFGQELKEVLELSPKRIAVIASGDMSHCLTSDAPMGFKPEGQEYDDRLIDAVKNLSTSSLLSMTDELRGAANACIHEQMLILFGLIERTNTKVNILSYEAPFGVGYLVAHIHL